MCTHAYTGNCSHAEGKDRLLYNHYASTYNIYYIIIHSKKAPIHNYTCTWISMVKRLICFILIFLVTVLAMQCVQWNLYLYKLPPLMFGRIYTAGSGTVDYSALACNRNLPNSKTTRYMNFITNNNSKLSLHFYYNDFSAESH